jgi:hypothetical protein
MIEFDIPLPYVIMDSRTSKDFKKRTITNYRKKDVVEALEDAIINDKIQESSKWMVELNCCGHYTELWDEVLYIYGKYVNINNFSLLEMIYFKYKTYTNISNQLHNNNKFLIHLRNNQEIRNLFIALVSKLTLSTKNDLFKKRTVSSLTENDYTKEGLIKNIKNYNLDMIIDIVDDNDIKELKLGINEIAYHMRVTKSLNSCMFWYQWIAKLENRKKRDDIKLSTNKRNIKGIDEKYKEDWIWLLWKLIFKEIQKHDNENLHKYIKYIYELYKIEYKPSKKQRKQSFIYMTFYCITTSTNYNRSIILKPELDVQINLNVNLLYAVIDNYLLKEHGTSSITKDEYIKDVIKNICEEKNKKISRLEKKKYKKEKKIQEDETENSNKMSYLNDLLYFKKMEKKKDVIKYFDEEDDKKKIIYL